MNRLPSRHRTVVLGALLTCLSLVVAACTGPGQAPPGGGPEAVINSPAEGASTAGTFFFSVQPLDAGQVASVAFSAGGAGLGTDSDPADGFRVFVAAADHADGPLELEAVVRGKDGRTTTLRRTVTNVPSPPSSTVVGAGGAALGTLERDGSLSALIVPPGTATGAAIGFTAMTQDEVKADTGVDYDALGITFLGAQDIDTAAEFERTLGVSSGGFGPAVQPGQAVVNYLIGPDADGDGVGELYVFNTASVAPNGDVVSDPVPVAQVGRSATLTTAGRGQLVPLAAGVSAAPGAVLELPVAGFNPASLYGNLAVFRVGGQDIERYARVTESPAGAQTLIVLVPPLNAGSGTLTLHNLGSGYESEPIDISVTPSSAVTGSAEARIDATLDLALDVLAALDARLAGTGHDSAVEKGRPFIDQVRVNVAAMVDGGRPEDAEALAMLAARFEASGIDELLEGMLGELAVSARLGAQQAGCNDILDRADRGMNMINDFTDLAGYEPPGGDAAGKMHSYAISEWWGWVKTTMLSIDKELGGDACQPPTPGPGGPGSRATPSGMGAAVPAGGNVGGNALPPGFRPIPDYSRGLSPAQATELERGRFHVSIAVAGSAVPFKGTTDAGGYFMVPLVPAGEPFTAVALDTLTGENRVAQGVGPAAGEGFYLVFDFSEGESEYTVATWDGDAGDGRWLNPSNWEGDSLPLPNADVVIPAGSGTVGLDNFSGEGSKVVVRSVAVGPGATLELSRGTLELLTASTIDGELHLTNGTIRPSAGLVVNGPTTWHSGEVAGTLTNRGTMTIDTDPNSNPRYLTGRLFNEGTVVMQGTRTSNGLTPREGGSVVNAPGATFEVRGAVAVQSGGGALVSTFDNRGTILKSSGDGVSHWTGAEVNHLGGTVVVEAGTLLLSEGTDSTGGIWEVSAGATLELGSHTRVLRFVGDYTGSGAGVVRLAGGERFEMGAAGASFAFPDGGLEWTGATIGGTGAFENLGTLHIVNAADSPHLAGTLSNRGVVVLRGNAGKALSNGSGASILNASGAVFEFHDDQGIGNGTPPLTLRNAGSLEKVAGVGTSTMWVCFVDEGGTVSAGLDFRAPTGCE